MHRSRLMPGLLATLAPRAPMAPHAMVVAVALSLLGCQGTIEDGPRGGASGSAACTGEVDVARTPLRRLTRAQYDNIVRDLLGVSGAPTGALSADERVGAFAINATNPIGLTQVREYMDVAELLAANAAPRAAALAECAEAGDDCARTFVSRIGRRVYRRPLTDAELADYFALYREFASTGFDGGIRLVITALLQSPHFLYHMELDDPGSPSMPGSVAALPSFALASRLSFFLWNGAPDDALLDAAAAGNLEDPAARSDIIDRMLDDDRARNTLLAFHEQWLDLERLDGATRDPALYPGFDAATITAMREETLDFVDYVFRNGGDLRTLLTASYSFPRGSVRDIVGAPPGENDPEVPVQLDPRERAGLLTQPSFLTAHSGIQQSSPIRRGVAIRTRVLCQPLGDPPPTLMITEPAFDPTISTRQRFAQHRRDESCASCHVLIDDLGFALENYDAVGRFREEENGITVDVTGELVATDVDGEVDGAISLAERFADSEQVESCVTRQWFRYALGRRETDADRCTLSRARTAVSGEEGLRGMLAALANGDALSHYVVPVPDPTEPLLEGASR